MFGVWMLCGGVVDMGLCEGKRNHASKNPTNLGIGASLRKKGRRNTTGILCSVVTASEPQESHLYPRDIEKKRCFFLLLRSMPVFVCLRSAGTPTSWAGWRRETFHHLQDFLGGPPIKSGA